MWWSKGKARQTTTGANPLATPMIMFLEPRMLFDGAVAATVADAAQADSHATADAAAKAPTTEHATASKDTHGQTDAPATPAPVAVPGQTVVFVDARVKDSANLLKGVAPGTEVVQLDASKDGLQQIADYLGSHQGVSSVQILAHGNTGDLWLGSTYLSADNIAARSEVLAQIGQDMNVGGDILIYACNTAGDSKGLNFVDSLAQLTGRDIAASSNRTGEGGDWTLEIATGSIESHTALSYQAMSAYQYGLATITVVNNGDSGVGSLRQALSDSVSGDTVTFSTTMTVNLNSQLVISKNVTIAGDLNHDGVADVTLSGQYKTQVLRVGSGVTATLDGLVITQGLAAGNGAAAGVDGTAAMGGGIVNLGNLTLNNVRVTSNAASGGGGAVGSPRPTLAARWVVVAAAAVLLAARPAAMAALRASVPAFMVGRPVAPTPVAMVAATTRTIWAAVVAAAAAARVAWGQPTTAMAVPAAPQTTALFPLAAAVAVPGGTSLAGQGLRPVAVSTTPAPAP